MIMFYEGFVLEVGSSGLVIIVVGNLSGGLWPMAVDVFWLCECLIKYIFYIYERPYR